MDKFTFDTLNDLIDQQVTVSDESQNSCQLTIESVHTSSMHGDVWEAFSVILRGDESFHIPQGTFTFSHDAFGDVLLFVSPKSEVEYEVIVNRKRDSAVSTEGAEGAEAAS